LAVSAPAGYRVDTVTLDLADPAERDLIEALRAFAELRGGTFPEDLSLTGLYASVQKMAFEAAMRPPRAPAATQDSPTTQNKVEHVARAMAIGRGLIFAGNEEFGTDWHYAGTDVTLGTTGRAILWYRPLGSAGYRVIDADLTVRDVPAAAVPTAPAIPIPRAHGVAGVHLP
jgi:hypothetical protein